MNTKVMHLHIDRSSTFSPRGKFAFTLVELLVVVAIIAVLASLLLPAITQVKSQANSTKCISGLRQVGMAFYAYASDNDDKVAPTKVHLTGAYAYVPAPSGFSVTASQAKWYDLLGPYIDQVKNTYKQGVFWSCPTFKGQFDSAYAYNDKTGYGRSPGLDNPQALLSIKGSDDQFDIANSTGSTFGTSPNKVVKQYIFSNLTYGSNRTLIGDSLDWGLSANEYVAGQLSSFWSDGARHRGKANYLCCDSNVRTLDSRQAWTSICVPSTLQ